MQPGERSGVSASVGRGVVYARETPPPHAGEGGWWVRWEPTPTWMAAVERLDPVFDQRFAGFGYGGEAAYEVEADLLRLFRDLHAAEPDGRDAEPPTSLKPLGSIQFRGSSTITDMGSVSGGAGLLADTIGPRSTFTGTIGIGGRHAMAPLYAPLVLGVAMGTAVLLWPATRGAWRRRRGRCGGCGYSRRGLEAAAACPECGGGVRGVQLCHPLRHDV